MRFGEGARIVYQVIMRVSTLKDAPHAPLVFSAPAVCSLCALRGSTPIVVHLPASRAYQGISVSTERRMNAVLVLSLEAMLKSAPLAQMDNTLLVVHLPVSRVPLDRTVSTE